MVVNHPQPALDGKIIITENIGALQTKQQDHLRRPDADALQRAQLPDRIRIGHVRNGVQVKLPRGDLFGKVRHIFRLAKGHAQRLQHGNAGRTDRFGIHLAERVLQPLPDRCLRLGRDLLADDMVDNGREQVRVYRALNMSDAVDDRAEPLVLLPQIGKLRFSVCKIHFRSLR